MNIIKQGNKIRNYDTHENKIAYILGRFIVKEKSDPIIHYFEIKRKLFKKELDVIIYCERAGLIIGKRGVFIEKLTKEIQDVLKINIKIKIVEFYPVIYPIYDVE